MFKGHKGHKRASCQRYQNSRICQNHQIHCLRRCNSLSVKHFSGRSKLRQHVTAWENKQLFNICSSVPSQPSLGRKKTHRYLSMWFVLYVCPNNVDKIQHAGSRQTCAEKRPNIDWQASWAIFSLACLCSYWSLIGSSAVKMDQRNKPSSWRSQLDLKKTEIRQHDHQ